MEIFELLISFGLVVLIWIIQCLHYPSFFFVDQKNFSNFEVFHTKRISWIVIPLMLSEVLFLILNPRPFIGLMVVSVWLSTFFLQVPCHNSLNNGFNEVVIQRLIRTNWIRTFLWTLKFLYLLSDRQW